MYLLLCGSTLLNAADPHVEFFQSQLQPWVHYVPVEKDFSDLFSRLQWLGDHQAEAQKIGRAGREWALRHLQPSSLVRKARKSPQVSPAVPYIQVFAQMDFTISAIKEAALLQTNVSLVHTSQLLKLGIKTVLIRSHADIDTAIF